MRAIRGLEKALTAFVVAIVMGMAGPAFAGDITIEQPWARASAGMAKAGGAFMVIHNTGDADDRLMGAKADVAGMVQIHESRMEDGVMKMVHIDEGVKVPAGGKAVLKPGSFHVMLMKLKEPLEEGSSFPLTLVFEKAGDVQVTVDVKAPGAHGPMARH